MRSGATGTSGRCISLGLAIVLSAAGQARGEVTAVDILDVGPMGVFDGRAYTWVSATMEGFVTRDDGTSGHYRVPITVNYPDSRPNGVATRSSIKIPSRWRINGFTWCEARRRIAILSCLFTAVVTPIHEPGSAQNWGAAMFSG